MNSGRNLVARPLINLFIRTHIVKSFSTAVIPAPCNRSGPINPDHLLSVCTILFQQKKSPFSKLQRTEFNLTRQFFLEVCAKFPYSWQPVYNFYKFTLTQPGFIHTPTTINTMLNVIGRARNIRLLWEVIHEMAEKKLVDNRTYIIALKTLASARELDKCVAFFHLLNSHGYEYDLNVFNMAVGSLCKLKLVVEANHVVSKLKAWNKIKPNEVTYGHLIYGFCDIGDTIEASRTWNLMTDEGLEPNVTAINAMMERFFKDNQFAEGLKLFQAVRANRMDELGLSTYSIVIDWMCRRGKLSQAYVVFEEVRRRGIQVDNPTLASLIYGLLSKNRIRDAYLMVENIEKLDISVYHALIKGFLNLKKKREATEVFREMIRKGCEPNMHTYIMLLQGHMGKHGRKGKDPLVNFESIFVGGLVKAGKFLEATKYSERALKRGMEVPRFDYNKFLYYYSTEEGVVMFEEVAKKLREVGSFDLADVFAHYGERMTTRERRLRRGGPEHLPAP